eukprot:scaffold1813_cov134-Skeletonema_dohrnii-CCMP3373.AAC.7
MIPASERDRHYVPISNAACHDYKIAMWLWLAAVLVEWMLDCIYGMWNVTLKQLSPHDADGGSGSVVIAFQLTTYEFEEYRAGAGDGIVF